MDRYKLADGSYSDQYRVGDKFVMVDTNHYHFSRGSVVELEEDDHSDSPSFKNDEGSAIYCSWWRMAAYKENTIVTEHISQVEELEAKIDNLEEYISELVHQNEQQRKVLDNFTQLTELVSTHSHITEALNAKIGDDVVERLVNFLKYNLDSLQQQARVFCVLDSVLATHPSFRKNDEQTRREELVNTVRVLQQVYDASGLKYLSK
jgi:TolA-binding protein